MTTKKGKKINYFPHSILLMLDPGSEIQNLGSKVQDGKNQDPRSGGSGICIPDKQPFRAIG